MRLLRRTDSGRLVLVKYGTSPFPAYATLSHTWLSSDLEINFDDINAQNLSDKAESLRKINLCLDRAAKDGVHYAWVDTCCIDRRDPVELQETITSMFQWYRGAVKCYVHMSDVHSGGKQPDLPTPFTPQIEMQFRNSRWFTRGWTLQEMLAPWSVDFFSADGVWLGDKKSLQQLINEITNIPTSALQGEPLANFTIAERYAWAENRQTTRIEDKAYCLLGIFSISMPTLYGEGEQAVVRLHEAIAQREAEKARSEHLLDNLPTAQSAAFDSKTNGDEPVCLESTRVEVLENIERWISNLDDRRIYWLNGIAGTGKSTIARTVARKYNDRGCLGGSFFFSSGGGDASQADKLVTTIAAQLVKSIPNARRHIADALNERKDIAQKSLRDQWDHLIIEPLSKLDKTLPPTLILVVIDALDECGTKRDIQTLLHLLAQTSKLRGCHLRIFLTSRPEVHVRSGFRGIPKEEREMFVLHEIPSTWIDRDLTTFFEVNLTAVREDRGLDAEWPGEQAISQLVRMASGLFIWAKTACIYIRDGRANARARTAKILDGQHAKLGPHTHLDRLYLTVLEEAFKPDEDEDEDERAELFGRVRGILGTIIILKSPLSVIALAKLLEIDMTLINDTLADLHAILHIPDSTNEPIRLHHPTFREFLLDKNRCTNEDFWIDEVKFSGVLARNCIRLMTKILKRNICNLDTPGKLAQDIDQAIIEESLPSELQYACLFWVEHTRQSDIDLRDEDEQHRFFKHHFLHWAEVLSIVGRAADSVAIFRMYQSLLHPPTNRKQLPFVEDARRLISQFHGIIKSAPLQLYCSALVFVHPSNKLRQQFWNEIHPSVPRQLQIVYPADIETRRYKYMNEIAFSPDSRRLATGSLKNDVRIWDVEKRAALEGYQGHTEKISSVCYSSDGQYLASASDDFSVIIFDTETKAVLHNLKGHSGWINAVTFSPSGKFVASGALDETLRIWYASSGEEYRVLNLKLRGINAIDFSPDGVHIAIASIDPIINIYDIEKDKIVTRLEGHVGSVSCVHYSPDGSKIVSTSDDTSIRIWETSTGDEIMMLDGHDQKTCTAVFAYTMPVIASGAEDKLIKIWNADDGTLLDTLHGNTSGISAITFSSDDRIMASIAFTGEVRLWNGQTREALGILPDLVDGAAALSIADEVKGHIGPITALASTFDDSVVASGCQSGFVRLWTETGQAIRALEGHSTAVTALTFSPDSDTLVSAAEDAVIIWNVQSGEKRHILDVHPGSVIKSSFSPSNRLLAICSTDKTIRLWNYDTGTLHSILDGYESDANDLTWACGGDFLAAALSDGSIATWRKDTKDDAWLSGTVIRGHEASVASVVSSNGEGSVDRLVSTSADATVRIWALNGSPDATLQHEDRRFSSAVFSADLKHIVAGSKDGDIVVWKKATSTVEQKITLDAAITSLAFSQDTKRVGTNRGLVDLFTDDFDVSVSDLEQGRSPDRMSKIFVTDAWLCCHKQNVLWLPGDYTVQHVVARGDIAVLGHASGAVTFIRL